MPTLLLRRGTLLLTLLLGALAARADVDLAFDFDGSLAADRGDVALVNYLFRDRGTISNNGGDFRAFTNPDPAFATVDGASILRLAMDDYLGVPAAILDELDTTDPIQLDLRFRFRVEEPVPAPSPCCPNIVLRTVLGTNAGDARDLGFQLRILKEADLWRLDLLLGDGRFDPEGQVGEGYFFFIAYVEPDAWMDLSLVFRLGDERPRLEMLFNGRPITGYLGDARRLDLAALRAHLEGGTGFDPGAGLDRAQLFIGGFPVANPRGADIDLEIDRFAMASPKAVADSAELVGILQRYTRVVRGTEDPGEDVLRADLQTFIAGFDGRWEPIAAAALAYFEAYEAAREPLFDGTGLISLGDLDPPSLLLYFLQQWVFDNLFVAERVDEVVGLAFEASESYPGAVAPEAPRVTGRVGVDASYATDPAVGLADQGVVLRPTGFYAAPGEPVTVRVPPRAAGAGLQVRIGIHRFDMEFGWNIFNRFPRISALFPIDAAETLVANPFGGGIYIVVPDGTDLGVLNVEIAGAVRMPMFSTLGLPGHSDDVAEFAAGVAAWHVPWFELHSRNFSTTQIMNLGHLYDDPGAVLAAFDDAFDQISRMAGRPLERPRAEWLVPDRFITLPGTAMAASYPIYPERDIGERFDPYELDIHYTSPLWILDPDFFSEEGPLVEQRRGNYVLWHEWGHLHALPTLEFQEQESNVHLLGMIVYNQTMGADLDTALARSGFQRYGFDEAALDTMFSPNWQAGERLGVGEQVYGIFDSELRYQTRSWARLGEIAGLYGWDAVGAIHGAFYDRGAAAGEAVNYGLTDDDFIETGSAALDLNLAPIFEFWGVPPSAEARARLADRPRPYRFLARLERYRAQVPRNETQYDAVYDRLAATASFEGITRLNYFRDVFDPDMGRAIIRRIDDLACRYLDCLNADGTPAPGNVRASDGAFADRVAVSWDTVPGTARYEVYRCATGGNLDDCRRIATVDGDQADAEDLAAGAGTGRHFYRVRACPRTVSCSDFSAADIGAVADGLLTVDVSGPWFNTGQPGHGWFVEQLAATTPGGDVLVNAYWYVYRDGAPVWLIGIGPLVNGVAELDVLVTAGGDFPPAFEPDAVELIPWGTLTFEFASNTRGTARWAPLLDGFPAGELPIQQIAAIEASEAACASGSYYNVDQAGHGFVAQVVTVGGETQVLLAWYVYLDGEQVWLLGQAPLVAAAASVPMAAFAGADFPPDFVAGEVTSTPWGTVELAFTGPDTASVAWSSDRPGYGAGSLELIRLTSLAGHACAR